MIRKILLFSLAALTAQPLCAKSVLNTDVFVKRAHKMVDEIKTVHGKNINALKPFSQKRTQKQDEAIEKEIHHTVRKMNREPGFMKAFFLTAAAEKDIRCPFLWYYDKVNASERRAKRILKQGKGKIKRLELKASQKRITPEQAKECKMFIEEITTINKQLETFIKELDELSRFIKQSESYTKELQSRPSMVPQTVYIY